jgi:group II intron reverse transcriptase/maturase
MGKPSTRPTGRAGRGEGAQVVTITRNDKVREMRDAETVLGIIHERGKQGLPLEDIYRQLYNPHLYLAAYENLRNNKGAMTPGVTGETVDGMSTEKIRTIIEAIRDERYRWTPVRRVYIPKKDGKVRPLGLPTWSDKLVQEVLRQMLEAYYDPQFSDHNHGYRPKRGCHTALMAINHQWRGTSWLIEGDISQCFDRLNHDVLMEILGEKLHDNRLLRLVENMLKAGYLEKWRWNATYSGSPQGGVISPLLSNIYLDRLDQYVDNTLLPQYTRGKRRAWHEPYVALSHAIEKAKRKGDVDTVHELVKKRRELPASDPNDPDFKRLRYVRYADDFLLGFAGPRSEAEEIKEQLKTFLRDHLKLELSNEKTLITHAATEKARFLGYEIHSQRADDRIDRMNRRSANRVLALRIPSDVVEDACVRYLRNEKPIHRAELLDESDYAIVMKYQSEYRGLRQYYALAYNQNAMCKVHYVMSTSLLKTLAHKHKASVNQMAQKYSVTKPKEKGGLKCLQVVQTRGDDRPPLVAEFGGIPYKRKEGSWLRDEISGWTWQQSRTDILQRMLADKCEICGKVGDCEVHHIRKLASLKRKDRKEKPLWMRNMIAMRRKTLVVCRECHDDIHRGKPLPKRTEATTGEPDDAKVSRPVRRGADGKGA